MTLALFLLTLGATARVTRLITDDYITRHARAWVIYRFGPNHDLTYLVGCPWCLSIWLAGPAFTGAYFYGHTAAWVIVCAALTASWVIGVAATFIDAAPEE